MVSVSLLQSHVLETVLADVEARCLAVLFREWTEVPRIYLVAPHLNLVDVLHFSYGFMFLLQSSSRWVHVSVGLCTK